MRDSKIARFSKITLARFSEIQQDNGGGHGKTARFSKIALKFTPGVKCLATVWLRDSGNANYCWFRWFSESPPVQLLVILFFDDSGDSAKITPAGNLVIQVIQLASVQLEMIQAIWWFRWFRWFRCFILTRWFRWFRWFNLSRWFRWFSLGDSASFW